MSSFFNEKLIAALKSGKYYCEKCGSLMEFEDEEYHDVLVCPSCGAKTDIEDYGFTDEELDAFYSTKKAVPGEGDASDEG